jgi:hypothetical protein
MCINIFLIFNIGYSKANGHSNVNDKHKKEICEVENLISITSTKKRFVRVGKKNISP